MNKQEQEIKLLKKIKRDILNRKKGVIRELPLIADYQKEFNLSYNVVKRVSRKLSREEIDFRRGEIQSQTGKKNKGNPNFYLSKLTPEQRRLNIFKGDFTEQIIKDMKERQGFKVVRLKLRVFNKELERYDSPFNFDEFKKLKNWRKIYKDLSELLKGMNNFKYPDFICEKEGKVVFTEVKSGSIDNYAKQKRSLSALAKKGYEVEIFHDLEGIDFQKAYDIYRHI